MRKSADQMRQDRDDQEVEILGPSEVAELELIPTLLEMCDRIDDETGMPVVGGHTLSIPQWTAFCLWAERNMSCHSIAENMGKMGMEITPRAVSHWRCKDWWKMLAANFTSASQQALFMGLSRQAPSMVKASLGILNGEEKYSKIGNAVVRLLQSFVEMGPKPLVSRGGVTIDLSTNNTQFNLGEISSKGFKDMSADEISLLARPDEDGPKKRR